MEMSVPTAEVNPFKVYVTVPAARLVDKDAEGVVCGVTVGTAEGLAEGATDGLALGPGDGVAAFTGIAAVMMVTIMAAIRQMMELLICFFCFIFMPPFLLLS